MSVSLIDGHIDRNKQKLTDDEIIQALECCKMPVGSGACNSCPLKNIRNTTQVGNKSCTTISLEKALDLITRQKEQIESLIAGQETLQTFISEKDKEIERLKSPVLAINNFGLSDEEFKEKIKNMPTQIIVYNEEQIKSEAVKEFAERLKDRPRKHLLLRPDSYYKQYVRVTDIDNLVKEMVGEG